MEKKDLLKRIDKPFLDRLFGFCYARTRDSYEAEQLCSDVTFAMVKAAGSEGEVENPDAFLWKIARNVYAEFSRKRKQETLLIFEENADKLLADLADEPCGPRDEELLAAIYRQIAFLTKIYRETMILFYLDGRPASEIAKIQGVSETAVRQRLFSARNKIRNEVTKMTRNEYAATTPTALKKVNYCIWGNGDPSWGDPRDVLNRQFSNHILSLCCKKPRSAEEIAQILNVPTLYVEEELEILTAGANGEYGFLRKEKGGKYGLNIILLDGETMKKGAAVYTEQIPALCDLLTDFIMVHEKEYLAFPYINRRVTLNLVLWQQFSRFANLLSDSVKAILQKSYFADEKCPDRPFSVFGYAFDGKDYGGIGHDGIETYHLEGYHHVSVQNLYGCGLKAHFHCGENISTNSELRLAIRAVNGLSADSLSEQEKEHAAKAVKSGYLYQEGDTLYTKILVNDEKDSGRLFAITGRLCDDGRLQAIAEKIAEKTAALIRETVPAHLLPEWRFFNILAGLPVADSLLGTFTERGILQLPKDGLDAEGCWISLETEKSRKNILREYSGYKKTDRFIPDSRYDLNGKLPEILGKIRF